MEKFSLGMLDESMNMTTKNKQLDLHVRHWTITLSLDPLSLEVVECTFTQIITLFL